MTTNKITGYSYDVISNTLTMTATFAKKASQLNTPEYRTVQQLRRDNPDLNIVMADKKANENRPLRITFQMMEDFISQCSDSKQRLEAFRRVKAMSKIQSSPYQYVKTWFLEQYANYSEQPEFDKDGFVIVKTRKEMDNSAADVKTLTSDQGETNTLLYA